MNEQHILMAVLLAQLVTTAMMLGKLSSMHSYWRSTAERRDRLANQNEELATLAREGRRLMEAEKRRVASALHKPQDGVDAGRRAED